MNPLRFLISSLGQLAAVLIWIAACAGPLVLAILSTAVRPGEALRQIQDAGGSWTWSGVPEIVLRTTGWGLAIAIGSLVVAIPAALAIAGTRRGTWRIRALSTLLLAALCLPSYLMYWIWWGLTVRPGSALSTWLRDDPERAAWLGTLQLGGALIAWTWPLVALCLGPAMRAIPVAHWQMLRLDVRNPLRRLAHILSLARGGVGLGLAVAFLSTITAYAAFDLAGVQTYGNVLRRIAMETGTPLGTTVYGAPMIAVALIAAALLMRAFRVLPDFTDPAERPGANASTLIALALLAVSIAAPLLLVLLRLRAWSIFEQAWTLERDKIAKSLAWSAVAGALIGCLCLSFAAAWSSRSRTLRRLATVQAIGWVWIGLTPAAAIGTMLLAFYNHPSLDWAYESPVIIVCGCLARFGMLAVLVGHWIAQHDARVVGDLRRLDGAESFGAWLMASGPVVWLPSLAAAVMGMALSLSEVSVTLIVTPPEYEGMSVSLLQKMHYQWDDMAMVLCLMVVGLVLVSGVIGSTLMSVWIAGIRRPGTTRVAALLLLSSISVVSITGCEKPTPAPGSIVATPLDTILVFGGTGRTSGRFYYPRATAISDDGQRLFVVDKTGRIQQFDPDGNPERSWRLPSFDNGFPTGLSVDPDSGDLFVADTHEHRILRFSADGLLLGSIGGYGKGDGQFLYPTDVAFGSNGLLYVSEYGGNDRIQVFDRDGVFQFSFFSFGNGDDEVSRPQGMMFNRSTGELWIADSCNHRIIITDARGQRITTIAGPGTGPGALSYPYDLVLQPDGSVLVAEYGNNRVQHLARDGTCLGLYGMVGRSEGELLAPWAIAADARRLYVLDSGNDRVQVIKRPD